MTEKHKVTALCLAGVAASLLLVGVVSATFVRHVIQVLPIVMALVAVTTQPRWGSYAAIPIFTLWLFLMVLIWLYLVGVQTFFTGTFSPAEVMLTALIGGFSLFGIAASVGSKGSNITASVAGRAAVLMIFATLQVGAMWASFLRPFANR